MENKHFKSYNDDEAQQRYLKEEAYKRASKKLDKLKGFYWHLASYIVVNIFLIILITVSTSRNIWNFGTFATAFFWGIGLFFHFLGVFGADFFFGKNWEERKIKEIMDKDEQDWE